MVSSLGREVAWICLASLVLVSCLKVSQIKGPDGQDDWLFISCSAKSRCLDEAAKRCPTGYKIADSGTEVSGSANGSVSSSSNILVKCTDGAPERTSSAPPPVRRAARGLGGFSLATPIADAIAQCENAGNSWKEQDGGGECSGEAAKGPLEGPVQIRTFKDRVYSLRMAVDVADDGGRAWIAAFRKGQGTITGMSGKAHREKVDVPEKCKADATTCLRGGDATLFARWDWPKEGFAEVRGAPGKAEGERPRVEVVLSLPAREGDK